MEFFCSRSPEEFHDKARLSLGSSSPQKSSDEDSGAHPNTLALPLAVEFVENPCRPFQKQDCDLKAFCRNGAKKHSEELEKINGSRHFAHFVREFDMRVGIAAFIVLFFLGGMPAFGGSEAEPIKYNKKDLTNDQLIASRGFQQKKGADRVNEWETIKYVLPRLPMTHSSTNEIKIDGGARFLIMTRDDLIDFLGEPSEQLGKGSTYYLVYVLGIKGDRRQQAKIRIHHERVVAAITEIIP